MSEWIYYWHDEVGVRHEHRFTPDLSDPVDPPNFWHEWAEDHDGLPVRSWPHPEGKSKPWPQGEDE